MNRKLSLDKKIINQIEKICTHMKIPYLRIFGSSLIALDTAQDVDLAIPYKPKKFSEYSKLISGLEVVFKKKVDLIFLDQIKDPRLALEILSTSRMLYTTKKGFDLFTVMADRLHGIATEEVLRFPAEDQIKNMQKISRRLHA